MKGKKIVLGITGSIAAYKACSLIRLLIKADAEVQVVITPAGKEFITPVTLSTLTSKPVVSDFFSRRDGSWESFCFSWRFILQGRIQTRKSLPQDNWYSVP